MTDNNALPTIHQLSVNTWQETQRARLNALDAQITLPPPTPQTFYVVVSVRSTVYDMFGNLINTARATVDVEPCLFRHRTAAERLAARIGGTVYAVELDGLQCPEDAE